jgi:sulfur-carrier protein
MIKVLFFGALREKIGCGAIALPFDKITQNDDGHITVAEVLNALSAQSTRIARALHDGQLLAAVNQQLTSLSQPVQTGDEVAFFPPVTGG